MRPCLSLLTMLLVGLLALCGPVAAQTATDAPPVDYGAWTRLATKTDALAADPATTNAALDARRTEIVAYRERFSAGQQVNAIRIQTVRDQIEALGPAPKEGDTEADDIAARRKDLNRQLSDLQAPALAAEEAYSRADGLIREIDGVMRARTAQEFLQRWPTPLNPANWPGAWDALRDASTAIYGEVAGNWADPVSRATLKSNLPVIVGLLILAPLLIHRGRPLIEAYALRLTARASGRGQEVWAFLASLGQIVVPVLGVIAVAVALGFSGLLGPFGTHLVQRLVLVGFLVFASRWLGEQSFPKLIATGSPPRSNPARRAKGRFYTNSLGLVLGLEALRSVFLPVDGMTHAAAAVILFPVVVVASILLYRVGHLAGRISHDTANGNETGSYRNQMISLIGRAAMIVACVAPLLAAAGYVSAGNGIVFPAIVSLALFSTLFTLQRFAGDLYALLSRNDAEADNALIPVLIGFVLTLLAIPVLALIWGARTADLGELFNRFREGFQIGQTRISPSDFVLLAVIFTLGMLATRLFQGALRSSILPKTKIDTGGKNAILAGIGYIGIFLSALAAINAAGIDLSGLAIVAGALSVGIGFGLQNIVSNFVSGIILLIERPVSEGDWIEVGGVQGTVKSISVRSTRIVTFDRTDVIVPNSDLVSGMVTNWTRFSLAGRLIVKVGVGYGSDTRKVERVLREIAEAQPLAILKPPPLIVMMGFGADSLDFEMRIILRDVNFSLSVRSEINHEIARRFAEEGIEIPFAQRDLWLRNPETLRRMWPQGEREPPSGPPATGLPEHRPGGANDPEVEGAPSDDAGR